MASDAEWAWLAGIIEGEGAMMPLSPTSRAPKVVVGMTDEDVVRRCFAIAARGKVYGPYHPPSYKKNQGDRVETDLELGSSGPCWRAVCARARTAVAWHTPDGTSFPRYSQH